MEKTQKTKPLILQRRQEGTAREKGENQRSKERVLEDRGTTWVQGTEGPVNRELRADHCWTSHCGVIGVLDQSRCMGVGSREDGKGRTREQWAQGHLSRNLTG